MVALGSRDHQHFINGFDYLARTALLYCSCNQPHADRHVDLLFSFLSAEGTLSFEFQKRLISCLNTKVFSSQST